MLDSVMGFYAAHRFKEKDASYEPNMAVVSRTLLNENAKVLTVLIPPWRGGKGVYMKLAKRLMNRGSAVLVYEFHRQILEPDVQKTRASFAVIQQCLTDEINSLVQKHGYESVDFISSSLGSVTMCMLASTYRNFASATFVVAGSNLARCLWEGSRTQSLRHAFEVQGMSEEKLDALWVDMAPKHWASAFTGKKVQFILSTTDKIIPSKYQRELLEAVRPYAKECMVSEVKTGHLASVTNYCLKGKLA